MEEVWVERNATRAYLRNPPTRVRESAAGVHSVLSTHTMVSLQRTIRSIQRVGLREWWRQMQYIGDAKSGRFVGKDQLRISPGSSYSAGSNCCIRAGLATATSRT